MIQAVLLEGLWEGRGEGRGSGRSHPEGAGKVQAEEDEVHPGREQREWEDRTGCQESEATWAPHPWPSS